MFALLAGVIPLAIAAAITPTLIAMQLLVVAGGAHWVRRAVAVIVANAVAFGLIIGLVLMGFAQLPDAGTGVHGPLDFAIRLIAGLAMLLAAIWFFWPHPALAERTRTALEARLGHAGLWAFFSVAFYFAITDMSSFIVLIPAIHDVTSSSIAVIERAIVMAIVLFIALQATILPALVRLLGGHRVEPTLQRFYQWVMRNQFPIVGAMCVAVGIFLVVTAFARR